MRCDAELVVLGGDRRIVLVACRPDRIVEQPVEIVGRQVERARIDRQHPVTERFHRLVIFEHLGFPAGQQRFVGPLVGTVRGQAGQHRRMVGRALAYHAQHLVEIGLGIRVDRRGDVDRRFRRHVIFVSALFLVRQGEEAHQIGVRAGDQAARDAVIDGEVEADILLCVA